MRNLRSLLLFGALGAVAGSLTSGSVALAGPPLPKLLIVTSGGTPPVAEMNATGRFSLVDTFDSSGATPTLGLLTGYDVVMAYTNFTPFDPVGLGDVLANAVDANVRVVIYTYSFSSPWGIQGRIMTHGYSPLVDSGSNGSVSGNIVALAPADPIFSGVTLPGMSFFTNNNYAQPNLDTNAILLADDGAGVKMIARSPNGMVLSLNLYPDSGLGDAEFYNLVANSLASQKVVVNIPALSDAMVALLALAFVLLGASRMRSRATSLRLATAQ